MNTLTLNQHTNALADYLPNGRLFEAKGISDSNFRQLLTGISGELFNAQGYIKSLNDEFIPDLTTLFLNEWEQALGIPDSCFSGSGSNVERRRDILTKLASLGVQTVEDFENVAVIFGVVAEVIPGIDSGILFSSTAEARYTIVINLTLPERFTYTFPFTFGDSTTALLECIFKKLKPGNCKVLFQGV